MSADPEAVEALDGSSGEVGRADGGSGTVLMLGGVAVAMSLAVVVAGLGAAEVARHRAESAADLAALAAADRTLGRATGDPCQAAAQVARAAGVHLTSCWIAGDASVVVRTELALPGHWSVLGSASAVARAGRGAGGVQAGGRPHREGG